MKKFSIFLILFLGLINTGFISKAYGQAPATLPYTQDFTAANDFTFINGTQTNKWVYGTAAGNPGSSIYVSNDNGATNNYTNNSTSTTFAYREFTIPAGSTIGTLVFDWRAYGNDSSWDRMRVYLAPSNYTPTAGTQMNAGGGVIQLGADFEMVTNWQTYTNTNVNLSSFAGSTVKLIFQWRNDGIIGTNPAAAVDNINFFIPTCVVPSALAVNGIVQNGATISWTSPTPAPANGFAYYLTTTNTPPTTATVPTGTTTATSINLGPNLTPNTTYYWWVKSVCSATDSSLWVSGPNFTTTQIPGTLPYSQSFTGPNDFGFVGNQENRWYYGSAAGNPANAIYISNDNGVTNTYDTGTSSSNVAHAYRDLAVPAGTTAASPAILSFDWRAFGEGTTWDYLRVWLVPSSFTPVAGTQITTGTGRVQIGQFNQQGTWQNYINTNVNLAAYAGSNVRLVFEWRNDTTAGTQPPAAVDNINLLIPTCKVPTALAVNGVVQNGATISWTATTPAPANGYAYYVSTTNTPPTVATVPTGTTTGTSVNLAPTLTPNTTYYWWVKAVCSPTDSSLWITGPSFSTTQIPATLPYIQPFTGPNDFGFVNGNQTNKWYYGSAAGNTGNSIYISNDNGTSNTYSTSTSSSNVTHAYRDIAIPAGTTIGDFSFDWRAVGEGTTWDYLRVWLVPSSYMPVAGTQITAGTGRIQIGQFNQQATWQNYSNPTLNLASYAGATMRLVFEWRNDTTGGTQPPAAVDNIVLRVCSTDTPVVTVTPASITHNSATLTWPQDPGGASYKIRYRPVGSATWLPTAGPIDVPAVGGTTQTYTFSGTTALTPVTLYEVEVAAVCNNTNIGVYSHNEFTTKCDPTPPNVTISNITPTSAVVTWSPLAASASYEIRWRIVGTPGWEIPPAPGGTPQPPLNSYTITGLNSFVTYEVQVRSTCNGTTTANPWSNPQVFTTVRVCEIPPPGLTITQLTPTSAEVTWDAYTGSGATNTYILKYRKVGLPGWNNITVNTNTHTLTGLLELTKYEMQVANVCTGTPGNYTPPYYFTTPTVTYCQMQSTNSSAEFISKVTATPNGKPQMVNQTTGTTYSNFTGDPDTFIELIQGSAGNQITIDKNLGSGAAAGVVAWIDFDRNGTFDLNERILADGPNTNPTATATFSVPADAFVSMTDYKYVVMRVAMAKDAIPVNCTSFDNGEVEDYTVRISKLPAANTVDQTQILIYPNPVKTVLNIRNISKKAKYKIYSASGQIISSGLILNNKIDVSRLINGVYVIDIEDAQGTVQKKFIKE